MTCLFTHAKMLAVAYLASCLMTSMLQAGGWSQTPQPLIVGPPGTKRAVATADAASSLAMDSGWRCLYSVSNQHVMLNYWTGSYFKQDSLESKFLNEDGDWVNQAAYERSSVKKGSALIVDQAWHMLFYISSDHGLVTAYRSGNKWNVRTISLSATHLLGVDQAWHIVYAYDEAQRSILALHWDQKLKEWGTETIAQDIGTPGAEGVVDSQWHVLYSSHADAPALDARGIADADMVHGIFKPWPLIATYWDGTQWRSDLIDKTALPQRPALSAKDHRVYYARRDDLNQSRWFLPSRNPFTTIVNPEGKKITLLSGLLPSDDTMGLGFKWLSQEFGTFVDDSSYKINWSPKYAKGWLSRPPRRYSVGANSNFSDNFFFNLFNSEPYVVYNRSNLNPVECYIPEWTTQTMPPVLKSYRSVMDERRGTLVHQTASADSGLVYRATSWIPVPNVYQRADGYYVQLSTPIDEATSEISVFNPSTSSYVRQTVSGAALTNYAFGTLERIVGNRFVTLDNYAPLPDNILGPRASTVTTMGHSLNASAFSLMTGKRYQNYSVEQERQADTGGIATDPHSSFVFYTQAADPTKGVYRANSGWTDTAPVAARPADPTGSVWIVVIF